MIGPRDLVRLGRTLKPADVTTLTLTFAFVGMTVGALLVNGGTSKTAAIVAAATVYAVTAELAYVAVIDGGGSMIAALMSGWLVASRFGVLNLSLRRSLGEDLSLPWRIAAGYTVVDPTVAIAAAEPTEADARRSYGVVTFWMSVGFTGGTAVGAFLGTSIGDPGRVGLDVVFPALLVAVAAPALRQRAGQIAGALSAVIALGLVEVTPGGVPVLLALSAAVVAARLVPGPRPPEVDR